MPAERSNPPPTTGAPSYEPCALCPRQCEVGRVSGGKGFCGQENRMRLALASLHFGEEPPLVGTRGSGTIFFSGCTGKCIFCQNYPISQLGYGNRVSVDRFAGMLLELQRRGAHNINFVTPTHFVPQLLAAVDVAAARGLRLPLVYNTSGYERVETLRLLEGVIDVWLPDAKYSDDEIARHVSGFPHYVGANRAALKEIFRQVSDALVLDDDGIARRGMIVRHLVLPDGLADTPGVMAWIAAELSPDVHVSLMDQYFPAYKALDHPSLSRKITPEEYEAALEAYEAAGLQNGWMQEHDVCE
jgi:putative pyruvate formate lyase activating enzyme